jgi:hypothetical protein
MLHRRFASRLALALGRSLVGTSTGRKVIAVTVGVAAVGSLTSGDATRSGRWSGLPNVIAPTEGPIELQGAPGKSATCTVRGKTRSASGNGWVFRGDAAVEEASCEGRIEKDGRVSVELELKLEWNGRIKGIGGDGWDDVDGKATCKGELKGTLAAGGKWEAKCERDETEWETSIDWKLDAD